MRKVIFTVLIYLIFLPLPALHAVSLVYSGPAKTKVFYSRTDVKGWQALVKGKILSFSVNTAIARDDLRQQVKSKSRVTVRLSDHRGIKKGDELFVIDSRQLVIARIKVDRIFHNRSMGYMLTGNGNFRNCREGNLVVQRVSDEYSRYALVYKGRGDCFIEEGETGKAIAEYKKALKLDRGNPEAHLALGYVYLKQGVLQFAFREFLEAYKNMGRLYDNEDRYLLLRGMAEIRFRETYYSYLPGSRREKLRKEGIRYAREALKIYPESTDVNYYLGRFHYRKTSMPENQDRTARDYFLKVIKKNPNHVDANIALSELYFKHKNREKARHYAQQALNGDPRNRRARQLIKYLNQYNREK